jgi:hypothetical protein
LLLLACVPGTAGARSATGRHCVFLLDPVSRPKPHVISARLVKVGCFGTLSGAIEAGTGGAIQLPETTTPQELTDDLLARSTTSRTLPVIGTEWNGDNYTNASNSYMAPDTCAGTTYELSYVTDLWNDRFESGKGFGGCDTNKKFAHANFGGDVLTCSPNCTDYGLLSNEVSSLKWKP